MKPRYALVLACLAWPVAAHALLGVGDIVFDPTNTAQTINLLRQAQQEFDRLGSLLGVSTRQFDQLVALTAALGNGTEAAAYAAFPSPSQLQAAVRAVPGLADADLTALFNSNTLLDAFLGVPLANWVQAVENPNASYRAILVNPALARVGGPTNAAAPTSAYAQWYAALAPEDRANRGTRSAADLSNLLTGDWLQNAKQRRVNLQALAAADQSARGLAARAQTLADQQHAQAQLSAGANAILLESAAQNTDAAEAGVRALHAQNQLLQDQDDGQRNAEEMRLDAPP
jgi:hypothetical protein